MRLQLALNVPDIERAVAYYEKLFGAPPHKRRPGYANFALDAPPLKLVLFENPAAQAQLNHIGVEVLEPADLEDARRRLDAAGLLDSVESATQCCHATQDKLWSKAHNGLSWEWYRVLDDEPDARDEQSAGECCSGTGRQNNPDACRGASIGRDERG